MIRITSLFLCLFLIAAAPASANALVEEYLEQLESLDLKEQKKALERLGGLRSGARSASPKLISMLSSSQLKPEVTAALKMIGKGSVPAIQDILDGGSQRLKLNALETMMMIPRGDTESLVPHLVAQLDDERVAVREAAAGVFPRVTIKKDHFDRLIKAIREDESDVVQGHCIIASAKLGDTAAAAFDLYCEKAEKTESEFVKSKAFWALGHLKLQPEQSIPILLAGLKGNEEIKADAASALGLLANDLNGAVVPALIDQLKEAEPFSDLSFSLARSLSRFGKQATSAVPVIQDLIAKDPDAFGAEMYRLLIKKMK